MEIQSSPELFVFGSAWGQRKSFLSVCHSRYLQENPDEVQLYKHDPGSEFLRVTHTHLIKKQQNIRLKTKTKNPVPKMTT